MQDGQDVYYPALSYITCYFLYLELIEVSTGVFIELISYFTIRFKTKSMF